MSDFEIGQRVVVKIADPQEYATGCAQALDNASGAVEEISRSGRMRLVRFDKARKKWWTNQGPVTAFWFDLKDLQVES